jgi:hypothetical protein
MSSPAKPSEELRAIVLIHHGQSISLSSIRRLPFNGVNSISPSITHPTKEMNKSRGRDGVFLISFFYWLLSFVFFAA